MTESCSLTPTYVLWHVCMPPHINTQVISQIKLKIETIDRDISSALIKIKLPWPLFLWKKRSDSAWDLIVCGKEIGLTFFPGTHCKYPVNLGRINV